MKFKLTDEYRKIAGLQVSKSVTDVNSYLKLCESEYECFKDHIIDPQSILELGCGLGRMSIFLNDKLPTSDRNFILADSTNMPEKVTFGWNPSSGFYNDLNLTSQFCNDHGLSNHTILDLSTESINQLKNIDLVISFLSVGFHYPIENYIPQLLDITTPECLFIFGVREDVYFVIIKLIEQTNINTKENILIMKKKVNSK